MLKKFGGINLSAKDVQTLVRFYKEVLEIPIINEDYGNYDGVQFGFSDKEPDFWIWSENK